MDRWRELLIHLQFKGLEVEPVGRVTTIASDAFPERRKTHGYFLSCRVSPTFGQHQIALLGGRGTYVCVNILGSLYATASLAAR